MVHKQSSHSFRIQHSHTSIQYPTRTQINSQSTRSTFNCTNEYWLDSTNSITQGHVCTAMDNYFQWTDISQWIVNTEMNLATKKTLSTRYVCLESQMITN